MKQNEKIKCPNCNKTIVAGDEVVIDMNGYAYCFHKCLKDDYGIGNVYYRIHFVGEFKDDLRSHLNGDVVPGNPHPDTVSMDEITDNTMILDKFKNLVSSLGFGYYSEQSDSGLFILTTMDNYFPAYEFQKIIKLMKENGFVLDNIQLFGDDLEIAFKYNDVIKNKTKNKKQ